jgi:zinc-binding alcohol dehydrogenase/oxidoreductase
MGAHVLATAGNDKDAEAINKQTSAHVVRYDYGDIARQVREATGSQVDMIFDSVAGPAWKASLESLRPGGRIVLAGTSAGDVVTHDLSDFYYYQWSLLGCRMGDEQDFDAMRAAVSDGQLRPIVGRVFNLSQIAEAHQAMEDGRVFGKIVLKHTE